jgi:hypothetical protein
VVIGIDFDNTIASYDELMHRLAVEWGWVHEGMSKSKKLIRDALRALPDGESKWRQLQTQCYGAGMCDARPMDGVKDFIASCNARQLPVWIVSHKTEFANFGDPTVNLRSAALEWMQQQEFFSSRGFGIPRERVIFEETREKKIDRIRALGITHFVDDLEETFLEESFPQGVAQLLYSPQATCNGRWRAFSSWNDIQRHLLGQ